MHCWGDENIDWEGISDAAAYIGRGLRKWGRMDVHDYKEKFGTIRVYCSLGLYWWPQLTHPGYVFNRWPRWTWRLQSSPRWLFRLLNLAVVPFHTWLYRYYYNKAACRWPHLYEEILSHADYGELFEGHIAGYKHSDFWRTV